MNANEIRESISRLRRELQEYRNNDIKGGTERRRNMTLLRWDIRKQENQLKAIKSDEAIVILNSNNLNRDKKFRYMMLSRMQNDCESYVYSGIKHLWACDETKHIGIMLALWHSLPVSPEWLTLERIYEYAKQMNVAV